MIKLLKLVPGGSNLFWSWGWRAEAPVCWRYQLLGNPEPSLEECLCPPQDSPSASEDVGATEEQFADNGLTGRKEICFFPLSNKPQWLANLGMSALQLFFPSELKLYLRVLIKLFFMSNWMINCVVILCFLHVIPHEKQFQLNTDLWSLFYWFQWVKLLERKPVKTTSSWLKGDMCCYYNITKAWLVLKNQSPHISYKLHNQENPQLETVTAKYWLISCFCWEDFQLPIPTNDLIGRRNDGKPRRCEPRSGPRLEQLSQHKD